jgi:hypothetical protein
MLADWVRGESLIDASATGSASSGWSLFTAPEKAGDRVSPGDCTESRLDVCGGAEDDIPVTACGLTFNFAPQLGQTTWPVGPN